MGWPDRVTNGGELEHENSLALMVPITGGKVQTDVPAELRIGCASTATREQDCESSNEGYASHSVPDRTMYIWFPY